MLLSKDIFNTLFILMIPILTLGGGFLFPLLVPIAFIVGLLLVLPALGFYFILNKIANFPEPYFKPYIPVDSEKSLSPYLAA